MILVAAMSRKRKDYQNDSQSEQNHNHHKNTSYSNHSDNHDFDSHLDDEHLKMVIRETVRYSVMETLGTMGFETDQMREMQTDMIYLRKLRKGSEDMARRVRTSVITVLVSAMLFMLWEAMKSLLKE